jgi:hypothetical protein
MPRDSADVNEVKVTPAMLSAGMEAFHKWMRRWDYFADGFPGDKEASACVKSIFFDMECERPSPSK